MTKREKHFFGKHQPLRVVDARNSGAQLSRTWWVGQLGAGTTGVARGTGAGDQKHFLRIILVLEAYDEGVGIAHDHNSTACIASTPLINPQVEDVLQEDIGEERMPAPCGVPLSVSTHGLRNKTVTAHLLHGRRRDRSLRYPGCPVSIVPTMPGMSARGAEPPRLALTRLTSLREDQPAERIQVALDLRGQRSDLIRSRIWSATAGSTGL